MKNKKLIAVFSKVASVSLVGLVCVAPLANIANAEVTAPVGYVKLTFKPQSDTPFSLPLNRPKVYSGTVSAINGNTLGIATSDFTVNQFQYDNVDLPGDNTDDGVQLEKYYVLFTTGALEGRTFDITVNGNNSITVDNTGASIQSLVGTDSGGNLSLDNFEIRPHWTLNTAFPDGGVLPPSSSRFSSNGQIFQYSTSLAGINQSASNSYIFVAGEGWYDSLNLGDGIVSDKILNRDVSYTLRNTTSNELTSNIVGDVPLVDEVVSLNTKSIQHDSYVAFKYPVSLSLNELGISGTSKFNSSSNRFSADGDQLILKAATNNVINSAATNVYIFVDGEGWYDTLNLGSGLITGKILNPGDGYIIRSKAATNSVQKHKIVIPYNPLSENN